MFIVWLQRVTMMLTETVAAASVTWTSEECSCSTSCVDNYLHFQASFKCQLTDIHTVQKLMETSDYNREAKLFPDGQEPS